MIELEVWIFRGLGGVVALVLGEYLINFRPSLPEKYRQKPDCEKMSGKCSKENREDHQTIFNCIENEHKEIITKLENINEQIIDIIKNLK